MAKYGSLYNLLADKSPQTKAPEVGMPATLIMWTDREPCTVIEVSASGKTITIQVDSYKRLDDNGMSECQEYEFSPNPNGRKIVARMAKNGRYYGSGGMKNGSRVILGHRGKYHDYEF